MPSPSASHAAVSGSSAPMLAMYASEFGSTGSSSMRVFHGLSAGKMGASFGAVGGGGGGASGSGGGWGSPATVPASLPASAPESLPPSAGSELVPPSRESGAG